MWDDTGTDVNKWCSVVLNFLRWQVGLDMCSKKLINLLHYIFYNYPT